MVEKGELTPEDARQKLEALQSKLKDSVALKKKAAIDHQALEEKLAAMVEKGELAQEEADKKLECNKAEKSEKSG